MSKLGKLFSLIDFMANPAKDIEVFGMFGAGNLGDEAMWVAAESELGAKRTVSWKSYANPVLNAAARRRKHPHLLVAGGTLIHNGRTNWLDYVEHRFDQGARVSFFGTGTSFTEDQIRDRPDSFKRWSRILQNSEEVHLRGPRSVETCREMGARADVFGDFALLLYDAAIPVKNHADRQMVIGFNFGELLGDQPAFERSAAQVLKHFHGRYELVCHAVFGGDFPVIKRIIAAAGLPAGAVRIERHHLAPHLFMQSVRNYSAFLGMRMHAAGLAMVAGVPSLMVAYRPKTRDFMAPLGKEDLLVDLPMDVDQTIARLEQILSTPDQAILTDRIAAIAAEQRIRLKAAFQ